MLSQLRGRRLLLDSNLLVLLCVGNVGPEYIPRHKRLRAFDIADFILLQRIVGMAKELWLLPNVATETSNLVRHFPQPDRDYFSEALKQLALEFSELPVASRSAVEQAEYVRLGLADAAILTALEKEGDLLLMTTDLGLYLAASQQKFLATNFNHLKAQRPDLN